MKAYSVTPNISLTIKELSLEQNSGSWTKKLEPKAQSTENFIQSKYSQIKSNQATVESW